MIKEAELNKLNAEVEAFRKMLIRILNEIPLKVFLKQYNGKFFVVNDAVSRFHGFDTPDGLIGKSDFDFYDHKDASEWLEAEHKIIREGKTEYTHEDGGKILRTVKMPFYIDPLNETGLLGYQADVTELETLKKAAAGSKQ
jgi:PAS domain S-box-containing protein